MRYKEGTLYYIESTCRRLGISYDIENDRFIPQYEDEAELMKWYADHFFRGLAKGFASELKKVIAERNLLTEEHHTNYKTKKRE